MSRLKVSVIQMNVLLGQTEANMTNMEKLVRQAASDKADVVVLPETWNTGFVPKNVAELAKSSGKTAAEKLSELARELKIYLVGGSIATVEDDNITNTAKVFDRNGIEIASYNKIHLFSPGSENNYFTEGRQVAIFEIEGHKCGIIICYDIRFPELIRKQALDGIEMLFVPAEWPHPRVEHWRTLQRARAIENQLFLISCNGMGAGDGLKFCGHSAVIDPWGLTLTEAEEEEIILQAELDTDAVGQAREKIPVFRDRRYARYRLS